MVASRLLAFQKDLIKSFQKEKNEWIAKARLSFSPGGRDNCRICGKFESVSHAHHIMPLNKQYKSSSTVPDHSFVWLCPTHHYGVHLLLDAEFSWPDLTGFEEDEKDAMTEIAAMGITNV